MIKKKERPADGHPWEMSPNRLYFFHEPEGHGFEYYATAEERDVAANDAIRKYSEQGNGWDEEVTNIVAGKLTHTTEMCDVVKRPPDSEIDVHGECEAGYAWDNEYTFYCDYKLSPLNNPEVPREENLIKSIDDFESDAFYWVRFNGQWLMAKVKIDYGDPANIADKRNWELVASSISGTALYRNNLLSSLTMFVGGIYKAGVPYKA